MPGSQITLYFLQASRCIRTAWLLEALELSYIVEFSPRVNGAAPPEFKQKAGGLGKFPALRDGETWVYESGNITEYLCDKYDTRHKFLPPPGDPKRYHVLQWVHASEGTFLVHGLAILYARWFQKDGDVAKTEEGLKGNILKDLDYLENELEKSGGKWICGTENFSAADVMMQLSIDFILARELGTKGLRGKKWEKVEQWLEACGAEESYKKAVKKTGHQL